MQNCNKLEIRNSELEGLGVFATDDIPKDMILEEVPFILLPRYTNISKGLFDFLSGTKWASDKEIFADNLRLNLKFKDPEKYYFKWFPKHNLGGEPIMFTVLPLGFGCIYNSSNTDNNAGWQIKENTFVFKAERDIKKNEEIKTFYGYFLGEDGTIFNCDDVFNMGIDSEGILRSLRFGDINSFESNKSNPSYLKIYHLITIATNGLKLKKMISLNSVGVEVSTFNFMDKMSVLSIYQKIQEFRFSNYYLIKLELEYINKDNLIQDVIMFKK